MKIGGFIKQSFIDWEGKISAVIFTKGCNFRCGFCHNPTLVLPQLMNNAEEIPEKNVIDYLTEKKSWLDGVVISGGEPTIQKDLKIFINKIKQLNFAVKLDTNGSNPHILKDLISENLLDYVAMDIKTILEQEEYCKIINIYQPNIIENIRKSIVILKENNIDFQLRTTLVPNFHSAEIVEKLKANFLEYNYVLQEFRNGDIVMKNI